MSDEHRITVGPPLCAGCYRRLDTLTRPWRHVVRCQKLGLTASAAGTTTVVAADRKAGKITVA